MFKGAVTQIKTVVVGDTDVGKTSLALRYCHDKVPLDTTPTIGASFLQKRLMIDDVEVLLQIWDTAGQERFRSMSQMYFRGAKAAVLVFDVTNHNSFKGLVTWAQDLRHHADSDCIVAVVANKIDLAKDYDTTESRQFAEEIGATFHTASAVTGEGVYGVFDSLATRHISIQNKPPAPAPANIRLSDKPAKSDCAC